MNWLFRRHFWIFHVAFLSIASFLVANIVTDIVGYGIKKNMPEKPTIPEPILGRNGQVDKDLDLANERNLFNARRESIELEEEEIAPGRPGRWQDARPTKLPLKLLSTMVFLNPFDSIAVIQQGPKPAKVYSIKKCEAYEPKHDAAMETYLKRDAWIPARACNEINGMATIVRIEEYRVYIFNKRENQYEFLSLLADIPMVPRKPKNEKIGLKEGEGIRKVGANSYEIDQSEFDQALSNVARLMTEARAVPVTGDDGNYKGFKIVYLKSDSLFEKIGIKRMDVLTRINGYELDSPEKALRLFSMLRSARQFKIDLERNGSSVTLDYTVVR